MELENGIGGNCCAADCAAECVTVGNRHVSAADGRDSGVGVVAGEGEIALTEFGEISCSGNDISESNSITAIDDE